MTEEDVDRLSGRLLGSLRDGRMADARIQLEALAEVDPAEPWRELLGQFVAEPEAGG